MFKDLEISRSMTSQFHDTQPSESHLSLLVFQPSVWPTYLPTPVNLPPDMQASLDSFKSFYGHLHKERTLTWIHSLGTAEVTARFGSGKGTDVKELSVSLHQAVVLLLFADSDVQKLTYKEIEEHTGIGSLSVFDIALVTLMIFLLLAPQNQTNCAARFKSSR